MFRRVFIETRLQDFHRPVREKNYTSEKSLAIDVIYDIIALFVLMRESLFASVPLVVIKGPRPLTITFSAVFINNANRVCLPFLLSSYSMLIKHLQKLR